MIGAFVGVKYLVNELSHIKLVLLQLTADRQVV